MSISKFKSQKNASVSQSGISLPFIDYLKSSSTICNQQSKLELLSDKMSLSSATLINQEQ